jgi:DNA-directed RNA polymerase specialized sigma24 family protein
MFYTKLIEALLVGDSEGIGNFSKKVSVLLVDYLKLRLMAEESDAQDASQQTMLMLFEMGTNQKIDNTEHAAPYILRMLRNEYYKLLKSRSMAAERIEPYREQYFPPNQVADLSLQDMTQILEKCVKRLSRKHRELYNYLVQNPDHSVEHISKTFSISKSNASTRKSRLVKVLRECVKSGNDGMVSTTKDLNLSALL